jgi:tetratricopeptide (TPR) repeat protein
MVRSPARWLTSGALALLGALVWIAAQAAEPEVTEVTEATPQERANIQQRLDEASTLLNSDRSAEAIQALEQALALATQSGEEQLEAEALRRLYRATSSHGLALRKQGAHAEAEAAWRRRIEVSEALQIPGGDPMSWLFYAQALSDQGLYSEAETAWRRCLEVHMEAWGYPTLPSAQVGLAKALIAEAPTPADYAEAEALLRLAAEILSAYEGGYERVDALITLGKMLSDQGRLDEAEQAFTMSVEAGYGRGPDALELQARVEMARWLVEQGRHAKAEAILAPCMTLTQSNRRKDDDGLCLVLHSAATASPREALRTAKQRAAQAEAAENPWQMAAALVSIAGAHQRLGHPRRAEDALRQAIDLTVAERLPLVQAEALMSLAEILEAKGETDEAAEARMTAATLRR